MFNKILLYVGGIAAAALIGFMVFLWIDLSSTKADLALATEQLTKFEMIIQTQANTIKKIEGQYNIVTTNLIGLQSSISDIEEVTTNRKLQFTIVDKDLSYDDANQKYYDTLNEVLTLMEDKTK